MAMNDEELSGGTEYNTRGQRPADRDLEQAINQPPLQSEGAEADATVSPGDAGARYGRTSVGTGPTATGTTNTTVDAGGATTGYGSSNVDPGGSTTLGAGDSMDDTTGGPTAPSDES